MDRSLSSRYGWVLYIRMRPHVLQVWIMRYLVGVKMEIQKATLHELVSEVIAVSWQQNVKLS